MHDRTALGPADVSDEELTRIVASALNADPGETEVLCSRAVDVDYDLPAITTAGRYWVSGEAVVDGRRLPYRLFVKHVQSWARSPWFQEVPPELRELAADAVPWRTEPLAYRSDLRDRLPDGLLMPRALAVIDLDELSSALWLEEVQVDGDATWDRDRYARAAHLLGQLAASDLVARHRDVGGFGFTITEHYLNGRLKSQVLPMLADPGLWSHPLVAATFDDELRDRLLGAAGRADEITAELAAMPVLTCHGDACPNNLMVRPGQEGFALIDYGFWGPNPVGFDLGQLLVGDVQLGRRPTSTLAEIDEAIVPAYRHGMLGMGLDVPLEDVRRAHALQLLLFTGLSSPPLEMLDREPTPELVAVVAERAELARYVLDLVDAAA